MFTLSKDYSDCNATTLAATSSSNSNPGSPANSDIQYIKCDSLSPPRSILPTDSPWPKKFHFDSDIPASSQSDRDGENSVDVCPDLLLAASTPPQEEVEAVTTYTATANPESTSTSIPATTLLNVINSILEVNKRAVEASQQAVESEQKISHARHTCDLMYKTLHNFHTHYTDKDANSSDEDWQWEQESNKEAEAEGSQPLADPSTTVIDDNKPTITQLSQWDCGKHPGEGWVLNDPLTNKYFPIVIPDPHSIKQTLIAPYIHCSILEASAQVWGTFGKGYPTMGCTMNVVLVDYPCPTLTPEQLMLLSPELEWFVALQKTLDTDFPIHISAGARRYFFYKRLQYSMQQKIKTLQHHEMAYMEKVMGELSELENTNIMGHLVAAQPNFLHHLTHNQAACQRVARILDSYTGPIPNSPLDGQHNPYRNKPKPASNNISSDNELDDEEHCIRLHLHTCPAHRHATHVNLPCRCYLYGHIGHVSTQCHSLRHPWRSHKR